MKVEDVIKANELVAALYDGIEMQKEILEGLRDSLREYNDFLAMQIRDLQRDESLISEVELVSNCCGAKPAILGELSGINYDSKGNATGRCSFCFEGCTFVGEVEYER